MQKSIPRHVSLVSILLSLSLSACGNNDTKQNNGSGDMGEQDMTPMCFSNEKYDAELMRCVPVFDQPDMDMSTPDMNMNMPDMNMSMDMGQDMDMGIDPMCDKDGDGALAIECGGDDCDDNNRLRSPNIPEICDDLDNDCDDKLNDNVECNFYAHTADTLYRVDPFRKVAVVEAEGIPRFLDIDTNPRTGELYGVTGTELWVYREVINGGIARMEWQEVGSLNQPGIENANGFAIDRDGMTAYVTARNQVYQINLGTGRAQLLTNLDNGANSSGDCVVSKGNSLYMSSKANDEMDRLLQIDAGTGTATNVGTTGHTNHRNIYGLTFAWNCLWGLTVYGELIEINASTAESTLVTKFENVGWYGSASTPNR